MNPTEVEIILKAIGAVRDDVHNLDQKFETFRTYADLTYVRKDNVQVQQDLKETLWKKRDRILARVAVLISAAAVLVTVLINTLHK